MLKNIFAVFLVSYTMSISVFAANFADDFKAAKKLMKSRKYGESQKAFIKLSEAASKPASRDSALLCAAQAAVAQKKFDEAYAIAAKIKNPVILKSCRMEIMYKNRKYSDIVKEFKDEDIDLWPKNLRAKNYQFRAYAYIKCKNGEAAEADLNKIIELGEQNKWLAMLYRGNNYLKALKDERKAADCLKQLAKEGPKFYWVTGDGLTKAVELLSKQKRFDEALQLLKRYNIDKLKGFWQARILGNYAKIYAAQGKKAEAVATYQKALAIKGLAKWQTTIFQKEIKKLK